MKTKAAIALKDDSHWMRMAFRMAGKAKGRTFPNPPVGAVLVREGRLIASGSTQEAGKDHAEVVALKKAGDAAHGATLYVTLEPCSHFGRTPPCTSAILAAGVARVVVPMRDPNPLVNGKGLARLRKLGVDISAGLGRKEAEGFYEGFRFYLETRRTQIILKVAQSLDGRINASPGMETALTGREARQWTHRMRTQVDAVLIGAGTLRSDDPALTPRLVKGSFPEALVLSNGGLQADYQIFSKNRKSATVVLSPQKPALLPEWVVWEAIRSPASVGKQGKKLLVEELLCIFEKRGYHSVLVEGGRSLWSLFLETGFWDRLAVLTAPVWMPGGDRWNDGIESGWEKKAVFGTFATLGRDYFAEYRRMTKS